MGLRDPSATQGHMSCQRRQLPIVPRPFAIVLGSREKDILTDTMKLLIQAPKQLKVEQVEDHAQCREQ